MDCPFCNIELSLTDESRAVYQVEPVAKIVKKRRIIGASKPKNNRRWPKLEKTNKSRYTIAESGYYWYQCGNCEANIPPSCVMEWLNEDAG